MNLDFVKCYNNELERLQMKQFFIDNLYNLDSNKKSILFSTPSETGTSHFRVLELMRAIYTKYPEKYNLVYTEKFDMQFFNRFDLIIQHRASDIHTAMLHTAKQLKHRKKIAIVHDVDDDEINVPKSNPLYDMWYAAGKDKMAAYQLSNVHYITTTGNELQKRFKKYNKNVKIRRNSFDWNLPQWNLSTTWRDEKNKEGKIVIGWAGLTSHFQDIRKMYNILKPIHDKYPNTYFVLAGMPTKNTASTITVNPQTGKKEYSEKEVTRYEDTYKYKVEQIYKEFDKDRIEFLDVLSLSEYGKFYSMFNIGLAYTEDNHFNHAKSEIKIIEYMKYGAVPIFSHMGGYKDFNLALPQELKDLNYSVLADNPTEWTRKLSLILDNYNIYNEKAIKLKSYVEDKYFIGNQVDEICEFYDKLINGEIEK